MRGVVRKMQALLRRKLNEEIKELRRLVPQWSDAERDGLREWALSRGISPEHLAHVDANEVSILWKAWKYETEAEVDAERYRLGQDLLRLMPADSELQGAAK
jgi:hypothetical protein